MVETGVETDSIEAILESWAKEIIDNFRRAEMVIRDSGVRDLLAQVKEESLPQEEFPISDIISSPNLTSQDLEEIANQVKKFPYHKPDLRCWLSLEWGGKDGRWRSIIVNADPVREALIIAGEEVRRLEKKEWQKEGVIFETLMIAIQKPTISIAQIPR